MAATVLLDARSSGWRRGLGPVAFAAVVEMSLNARPVGDRLWFPGSVRELAAHVGAGRATVAQTLRALASDGLVERAVPSRAGDGRFAGGGYWLCLPEGLSVAGFPAGPGGMMSVSGFPAPGFPGSGIPDPDGFLSGPALSGAPNPLASSPDGRGATGGGGQAQLFVDRPIEEGPEVVAGGLAPPVGVENVGALVSAGCEGPIRVHELAPGVPIRPAYAPIEEAEAGRC
jgi:Bacterial regulatory proteins, gntR family